MSNFFLKLFFCADVTLFTDYDNIMQIMFNHHWYIHAAMKKEALARCKT